MFAHSSPSWSITPQPKLDRAASLYERAWRIAEQLGNRYLSAVLANNLGVVDDARGDAAGAEERFEQAVSELTAVHEAAGRATSALNLALMAARSGDAARADGWIDELSRIVKETAEEGRAAELVAARGLIAMSPVQLPTLPLVEVGTAPAAPAEDRKPVGMSLPMA